MDLQSVAAELPQWEPFIRRFRVHDWMRSRIAVEVDDVRQECRLRACIALAKLRAERPALKGTADEVRIVNRAIARAFVDCVRKANCVSRLLDDTVKHTIQSGASWVPAGISPSLEEEYLAGEHAAAVERACEEVRAIMGDDAYFDVLRTIDGERGGDPDERAKAKGRRYRAIEKVRRRLQIQPAKRNHKMTEKHANTLNDDDLARVALVYKKIHGAKVTSAARAHLLEKVEAINSDAQGKPFAFPPCFGSSADYDPTDSTCKSECDFRVECGAIIPAHYDAAIEEQLVQLKSGGEVVPLKPPKPPKPAPPAEIQNPEPVVAVEAAPEAKEPAMTKTKPTKTEKAPKPKKERAVAVASPGADAAAQAEEDRLNAEDEARAQEATVSSSKAKPKKERAVAVTSPGDSPAPAKAKVKAKVKAKPERKPRPKGKTTLAAPVALSTRPGVLKGKKRATRPDGTPFFRLPQGSAAELASLPVGEKRERDHDGFRYFVKKIADGIMTTGADGVERKRDGTWQLLAKAPIHDDGTIGAKETIDGVVGSLGVITRFITGSNVWSASRFWRVIPPLLDPHHPDFNPSKWKPRSVYAYGATKVVAPKKKAKKKAKA